VKVLIGRTGIFTALMILLGAAVVSPQETHRRLDSAVKFDEYGQIGGCDHSARLDNLAIELQNNPHLEAYLVYYGPKSASEITLGIIKDYLVNSRGIDEEREKTIYAGPNEDPHEPRIQLWLAPQGAPPPELARYENKVETFNGLFTEQEGWDGIYDEDGGTGPPIPGVSLPTFIDMLEARKDTVAYIVAFTGTESAPGAWRRVAQRESENLQSKGVTSGRIRIIYGGSDKESKQTKVQFWILPENEPPPVADAGPELAPATTKQIGTYNDYELGDESGERWAFQVLLDALHTSEELRACIIVRLEEAASDDSEEAAGETPPVTNAASTAEEIPEPQRADLLKLIDKWKSELTDKNKIRDDRLIVLFTKAREFGGNTVETWIVPPGALLPDPNAEPEEESSEETGDETAKESDSIAATADKDALAPEVTKADKAIADKPQPDKVQPDKPLPAKNSARPLLLPDP
jgi:hypothetical protein